jgi:glutamine synthetase
MTPKDVLKLAKEKGARIVDLRFIDLPGLWQHFSIPVSELTEGISRMAWASTVPPSEAFRPSMNRTCC